MKKTAVEWLVEKLEIFATEQEMNIIKQAKAMEKQQIIDAWLNSLTKGDFHSAEEYYNETFKSDKGCACYGSNSVHKCNCK